MKKYSISLLILGLAASAQAGLISHTDYTSGNTITAAAQNSNENAIVNEFNGNIDTVNLKDSAVTTAKLASAVQAQFVPSASIFAYVGSTASVPSGYLYCDGSAVSRTTYATLFAAVGTAFGSGNGSTTFNLPDLRGKFMRGANDSTGNDPDASSRTACATGGKNGDQIGSCQSGQYTSHTHTANVTDPGHVHGITVYSAGGGQNVIFAGLGNSGSSSSNASSSLGSSTTGITVTNTSSGGNETRPINVNVGYIIKT